MNRSPEERITTAAAAWGSIAAYAQFLVGWYGWKAALVTMVAALMGGTLAGRFCWRDL